MVALGEGGACETVIDGTTGALVPTGDAAAFADAIRRTIDARLDAGTIRRHAEGFSKPRFQASFTQAVTDALADPAAAR